MTEISVEIIAVRRNSNQKIKINIDEIIHFRITDESYSIDTFMDLISEKDDFALFSDINGGQCFFENLDEKHTEWVLNESYFPLDKKWFKQYVFFLSESFVEIISSSPPVCSDMDIEPAG